MGILLTNATLVDLDPVRVESGGLRIAGEWIDARGRDLAPSPGDEVVDCGGAVVLPGLVNGHTHLYSALATGMPAPPHPPRNFREILEFLWWRLDRALDAEAVALTAEVGALAALRCGTTTLIDHHASPNAIGGSLDAIERGIAHIGLRGVLCYEVTDRNGPDGCKQGLEENARYAERCRRSGAARFANLVGAHASFTLEDATLERLAELADATKTGIHIHVAEDPCDADDAIRRGTGLIDRLNRAGLLRRDSVLAHGTHLGPREIEVVSSAGATLAHNPRSNMNNAVGYTPVASFRCPIMLGTDGIGGDLLAEARAAWLISRHQHAGLSPSCVVGMLAAAARRASASLGITLGRLAPAAAADIVITAYSPATALDTSNVPGHLLFGLDATHVRDVLVGGSWRLRDRRWMGGCAADLHERACAAAAGIWKRMAALSEQQES
ncbi:MAG: amidohydrolase family protein [Planctomycetes bacterium]|nr:amidohydrolase family protein [Planctomycetota bacterium]